MGKAAASLTNHSFLKISLDCCAPTLDIVVFEVQWCHALGPSAMNAHVVPRNGPTTEPEQDPPL